MNLPDRLQSAPRGAGGSRAASAMDRWKNREMLCQGDPGQCYTGFEARREIVSL
jgi:hypothetical protein